MPYGGLGPQPGRGCGPERSGRARTALTGSARWQLGCRKPGGGRSSPWGISWVTGSGRPRQPDGPCSVEAETARLVRRRTGVSANGVVLVLERAADSVGPACGHVEVQVGHPRGRSGRPVARVPAAGPRARSGRECVRRGQACAAVPGTWTRVAGGSRRFGRAGRGLAPAGQRRTGQVARPGFRPQESGIGSGQQGKGCREGTGRTCGRSRRRLLQWRLPWRRCSLRRPPSADAAVDGGGRARRRDARGGLAPGRPPWRAADGRPRRRPGNGRRIGAGRGVAG